MASSDDDDYDGNFYEGAVGRQYPIHDACEHGDVEDLRVSLYVRGYPQTSGPHGGWPFHRVSPSVVYRFPSSHTLRF